MNEMVLLKNRKKPKKKKQEIVCMSSQCGGGNDGRGIYIYILLGAGTRSWEQIRIIWQMQ
jgi:hypothetical protein